MVDPNWRELLPQLGSLPLLPCGTIKPNDGGKVPIDPSTGRGLQGWQKAAFTPAQLARFNSRMKCVGTRTGPDADGLIVFDLDGSSAIAQSIAAACDPADVESWIIRRDTATDRLKVAFTVPFELWSLLGLVHAVLATKPKTDTDKGEQIEVFFGVGQIIALGEHIDSGGNYVWDGSPQEISEIPPEWWALAISVIEKGVGTSRKDGKASENTAGWRTIASCPICGRNEHIACRANEDRSTVLCFHGGNFHPPTGLSKGQVITGKDGKRWAFCGTGRHHGDFSTFRLDRPIQDIQLRNGTQPPDRSIPAQTTTTPTAGQPFAKRHDTRAKWGKRSLSLSRRIAALNRCIKHLADRERNSLRRMARVRHSHAALDLKTAINLKEIGQLILEQLDERTGNHFHALTADDRLSMPIPTVEWLVENCIPAADLTILGGRAKVGKTRLANALVRCLLLGEDFLGFGRATTSSKVILVTDDQGDGDTAEMLQQLGLWEHPDLLWSRRFRVTEANIDRLLETIDANPGAVVILDSLRSITRSTAFGENDPEMGGLIYDLKQQIIDAGGAAIVIHHCNKSNDATGTEALSGHNAIAGAANTIITLHYLAKGQRLLKDSPQRRFVREARSGPPADLVVSLIAGSGAFSRDCEFEAYQEQQEESAQGDQIEGTIKKEPEDVQAALRLLHAHHKGGSTKPPGLMDICKAVGVASDAAMRVGDLRPDEATAYKRMGKTLGVKLAGAVTTQRVGTSGGGFYVTYALNDEGAAIVGRVFSL